MFGLCSCIIYVGQASSSGCLGCLIHEVSTTLAMMSMIPGLKDLSQCRCDGFGNGTELNGMMLKLFERSDIVEIDGCRFLSSKLFACELIQAVMYCIQFVLCLFR